MPSFPDVVREVSEILERHYAIPAHLSRWYNYANMVRDSVGSDNTWTAESLNRALRGLGLSHTLRFTSDEVEFYNMLSTYSEIPHFRKIIKRVWRSGVSYTGIGISSQRGHRGYHFVSGVLPRSPAERAGLTVGDELIAVDDQPFQPILSFKGLAGRWVRVQFRRVDEGPILERKLIPTECWPSRMFAQANRRSARIIDCGERQIGYIKAWSLAGAVQWRSLTGAILRHLTDCTALILDLRGGAGGASPDYADFFLGRSPELRLKAPRSDNETIVNARWRKPIVAVANYGTRSGGEVLAFALRSAGVPLVGGRTAGQVVAGSPFLLGDGSLLLVASQLVVVDGRNLEGIGVEPTVPVPHEIQYSNGNDPTLREACRIASML